MANSPVGLGSTAAMEPGSYPSWHTNRTLWAQLGPGSALQSFMACNGWTRLWPENNTDATASSPVSRVQPTPCQSYAIQTSHTPTYGSLLAGIHLARVAVNILDNIIRLGQYGTKCWLTTGMNGSVRPEWGSKCHPQHQFSSASRRYTYLWSRPDESAYGSLIIGVAGAGASSAKKWEAL